jgi:hypothetical protein
MARRIEAGMAIIGKISVEPGRISLGITVEFFAGINANPVHDHQKDRTARCPRRGIHIVVILQNVHSILFNLGYKERASWGVMLPCFYYIEFTGIIVLVL